mgnify:FL=1|jgi:hypothetical protein|tara:strand:- start:124 stop:366 length:243 start_codon:yes stop_codon:yes gene_type:complete
MTKDLINIIDNNIQYLKACLDLTEAHITWGTKNVKEKYSKVKERLQNKIKEQYTDKRVLTERYDQEVQNSIELSNLLSTI